MGCCHNAPINDVSATDGVGTFQTDDGDYNFCTTCRPARYLELVPSGVTEIAARDSAVVTPSTGTIALSPLTITVQGNSGGAARSVWIHGQAVYVVSGAGSGSYSFRVEADWGNDDTWLTFGNENVTYVGIGAEGSQATRVATLHAIRPFVPGTHTVPMRLNIVNTTDISGVTTVAAGVHARPIQPMLIEAS